MVDINLCENNRIYILKKEYNPGKATTGHPAVADYYDFTDYMTYFKINKKLSNYATIEITLAGIDTSTLRSYVKAGNYLFVMTGYNDGTVKNKLIGKFLLEKPVYSNQNTVSIKGIQSVGNNSNNKQLTRTDSSFKIKRQNDSLQDVLFDSQGICVDSEGNNVIYFSSFTPGTLANKQLSLDIDYIKRSELLQKAFEQANCEWDIDYGDNDATYPFEDGDSLTIANTIGDISTSQYTFYLSGTSTNCFASRGVQTVSKMCNNVIVKGTDLSGTPIDTNMFDGGSTETTISLSGFPSGTYNSFDAWLYEDITAFSDFGLSDNLDENETKAYDLGLSSNVEVTATNITFTTVDITVDGDTQSSLGIGDTHTFSNGTFMKILNLTIGSPDNVDFTIQAGNDDPIKFTKNSFISYHDGSEVFIKLDNEVIKGYVDDSNLLYTQLVNITRGVNTSIVINSGTFPFDTSPENHKAGSDIVLLRDGYASGDVLSVQLPISSTTGFTSAGYIYIGSERAVNVGSGTISNSIEVIRINGSGTSSEQLESWNNSYAHSDGIRVMEGTVSGGGDYVTPDDPYTGSNIDINGLYSETFTEESAVNKDALDKKCQLLLSNRADIDDVVELEVDNTEKFFTDITLGDGVSISGADVINLTDSGASPTYRFIEYQYTWPPAKCIAYLNKIEKVNEFNTGETFTENYPFMTKNISNNNQRGSEFNNFSEPSVAGEKNKYEFYNKEVDGIVLNKSYSDLTDSDNNKAVNVSLLNEAINTVEGQSLWETTGSDIQPITSGADIRPNGTANVGTSSDYWDNGYFNSVYSGVYYLDDGDYYIAGSTYLSFFGNEENLSGTNPVEMIRIHRGSLTSAYTIPSVDFKDALIIPLVSTQSIVETVLYNTYTSEGSLYYDSVSNTLRIFDGTSWSSIGSMTFDASTPLKFATSGSNVWSISGGTNNLLIHGTTTGTTTTVQFGDTSPDYEVSIGIPNGVLNIKGGENIGKLTLSTSAPSGGSNGDIWFKY